MQLRLLLFELVILHVEAMYEENVLALNWECYVKGIKFALFIYRWNVSQHQRCIRMIKVI